MAGVMTLPRSRPLTREVLADTPDDGHRYELLDGVLLVSPAPRYGHQRAVARLLVALAAAAGGDLEVLTGPFDVVLAEDTVLQPDVLVARRSDITERDLPAAPLLAVEVLSPSTRRIDLLLKRSRYAAAGCPAYLVVDPDEPSAVLMELDGEEYVETSRALGDQPLQLRAPAELTLVPAELVR